MSDGHLSKEPGQGAAQCCGGVPLHDDEFDAGRCHGSVQTLEQHPAEEADTAPHAICGELDVNAEQTQHLVDYLRIVLAGGDDERTSPARVAQRGTTGANLIASGRMPRTPSTVHVMVMSTHDGSDPSPRPSG